MIKSNYLFNDKIFIFEYLYGICYELFLKAVTKVQIFNPVNFHFSGKKMHFNVFTHPFNTVILI